MYLGSERWICKSILTHSVIAITPIFASHATLMGEFDLCLLLVQPGNAGNNIQNLRTDER